MEVLIEGQTVRHEIYGLGTITESNSDRTSVDFEDHGMKKFVTSLWNAELIGEPPEGPRKKRRRSRRKPAAAGKSAGPGKSAKTPS